MLSASLGCNCHVYNNILTCTFSFVYAGCAEEDLIDKSGTMHPARCADRGFVNGSSISDGVVCYNGTTVGSGAVCICDDGFVLMGNEVEVCPSNGSWNGSIPRCIPEELGTFSGLVKFIHFTMSTTLLYCISISNFGDLIH